MRRLVAAVALVGLVGIVGVVAMAPATRTATGVVVAVDAGSLTDVRSFTIREPGGQTRRFEVGALQNATEFPPGHLVEHIASGEPVIVTWREEDGQATAVRIVDGPVPSFRPTPGPT